MAIQNGINLGSTRAKPNIVVVGGSYVGAKVIDHLAPLVHETHNIVLVEKNSHFQHLFAFPRMNVIPGYDHRAFIPYTSAFFKAVDSDTLTKESSKPSSSITVHQGLVTRISPSHVILANEDDEPIPYEYLVLATGTGPPNPLKEKDIKKTGMRVHQALRERITNANKIVVVGGGAFGVQVVTDLKTYPPTSNKHVTLIHSRPRLLNRFGPGLHEIVMNRCSELGIDVIVGERIVVPPGGFPTSPTEGEFEVRLKSGGTVKADFVLLCTGSAPLSHPLQSLSPESIDPTSGYIKVKPTLQIHTPDRAGEEAYRNVFAIGDVADTGAHKAARPGYVQAAVVARNIHSMIRGGGKDGLETYKPGVAGIHMTLGLDKGVIFQDTQPDGKGPPAVKHEELNGEDLEALMSYERWWKMRADGIKDYFL
ncbi:FAD/NAD(P)-binding domain-containing protein [Marasmius fiardii PR-910]|nr:FAD/NAD(P)-binding domain-containing protein [Marasmius fiardii PR-910]